MMMKAAGEDKIIVTLIGTGNKFYAEIIPRKKTGKIDGTKENNELDADSIQKRQRSY